MLWSDDISRRPTFGLELIGFGRSSKGSVVCTRVGTQGKESFITVVGQYFRFSMLVRIVKGTGVLGVYFR